MPEPYPSLAVLITCHNRATKTVRALKRLFAQDSPPCRLSVYLVDDGSSDGTAKEVARTFPQVKILVGDGTLFWGGGMALAFDAAAHDNHDFYLWLNDDTYLFRDALRCLFKTYQDLRQTDAMDCIIVGTTRPEAATKANTGGLVSSSLRRFRFEVVESNDRPQRCDTFNGNCVLLPRHVTDEIGGPDRAFRHFIGDIDYGLRAGQRGFESWVAPGFAGTCEINKQRLTNASGICTVLRALVSYSSPKGVQLDDATIYSFREWARFTRRHGGPFWFIYFAYPYRRLLKCLIPRFHR
jgi:GT2 family glycosyltransferase